MTTTDADSLATATAVAPLSLNQQFNSLFDGGGDDGPFGCRNHVVAGWRVTGAPVDPDVLRDALLDIVTRHEALRTRIAGPPDDRYQQILPPSPVQLDVRDFPAVAEAARAELAETLIHEIETQTMSAHEAPFLRAVLARFDDQDAVLILMAHHLSVDGLSFAVIIRDLAHRYAARTGHSADLPATPQYREYGIWEREAAASAAAREFWRRQLDGARFTAIPTDIPRSAGLPGSTARHRFLIPGDVVSAIERVARSNRTTRFMAIAAIYQLLVHRLTGVTDVVMATFTPGRGATGLFDETVGTLYNFVPLRTDLTGCKSYEDVLKRTRRTCLEALSHDIPTMQIFAEAPQLMEPAMTDNATAMVLESVPTNPFVEAPGDLKFAWITRLLKPQELTSAIPDGALWDVNKEPAGDAIGAVSYKRNLFREDTIAAMAAEFGEIARVFSSSPDASPGLT